MTVWTGDAKELLEDYLTQVAILLGDSGEDAKAVAHELRAHITEEAEAAGAHTINADTLRSILRRVGSPAEIAGVEESAPDAPRYENAPSPATDRLWDASVNEPGIRLRLRIEGGGARLVRFLMLFVFLAFGFVMAIGLFAVATRQPGGKIVPGHMVAYADPSESDSNYLATALVYSDDAVQAQSAAFFVDRMAEPEPGYEPYAGLWAFVKKGENAAPDELRDMIASALRSARSTTRPFQQRWMCIYAASSFEEPWVLPDLAALLQNDSDPRIRAAAACGLGYFVNEYAARLLRQALDEEQDPIVRGWIERALAGDFPRLSHPSPPEAAG